MVTDLAIYVWMIAMRKIVVSWTPTHRLVEHEADASSSRAITIRAMGTERLVADVCFLHLYHLLYSYRKSLNRLLQSIHM